MTYRMESKYLSISDVSKQMLEDAENHSHLSFRCLMCGILRKAMENSCGVTGVCGFILLQLLTCAFIEAM